MYKENITINFFVFNYLILIEEESTLS